VPQGSPAAVVINRNQWLIGFPYQGGCEIHLVCSLCLLYIRYHALCSFTCTNRLAVWSSHCNPEGHCSQSSPFRVSLHCVWAASSPDHRDSLTIQN
jgi:hypothetical protein